MSDICDLCNRRCKEGDPTIEIWDDDDNILKFYHAKCMLCHALNILEKDKKIIREANLTIYDNCVVFLCTCGAQNFCVTSDADTFCHKCNKRWRMEITVKEVRK